MSCVPNLKEEAVQLTNPVWGESQEQARGFSLQTLYVKPRMEDRSSSFIPETQSVLVVSLLENRIFWNSFYILIFPLLDKFQPKKAMFDGQAASLTAGAESSSFLLKEKPYKKGSSKTPITEDQPFSLENCMMQADISFALPLKSLSFEWNAG